MPQREELENIITIEPSQIQAGQKEGKSVLDESARIIANMLSDMAPEGEATRPKAESTLKATFLGDGLPPIPARLAERICRWEYVDMSDLLPEFWPDQKAEEGTAKRVNRSSAKKRVQDINVWLQCYAIYVGVMATKSPEMVPELMAYMISIIRASQEYEGLAWATYDAAYRRQAAATGHKQWSKVNPSLYTVCFTGKARKATRCDLCLSAAHKTSDCSLAMDEDPDIGQRLKAVESAVIAFSGNHPGITATRGIRSSEVCRLFNEKRCKFRNCKYRHVCRTCQGNHPAPECPSSAKRADPAPGLGPGPIRRDSQFHNRIPDPY